MVEQDEFYITRPIGKVGEELRRVELSVEEGGQEAKTFVKVLKRFPQKNSSLLEVTLFTGRTHQIRAHLSLEGYPVRSEEHTSELQSRQYLVCRLLLEKKKTKC